MCRYKHSMTKIETSYVVALLNGKKLPICRLQILKMLTLYFYSCLVMGNSLSVTQKVHDFRYRKKELYNIVKI